MRTKILVAVMALVVTAGVLYLKLKTKIDWSKLQSVEVYADSTDWKDFERMKDVDFSAKPHYTIDPKQAREVLGKAKTEVQLVTVWKNYRYAVVDFGVKKPLRLKISKDGGFFLVLNFGRKYEIREEDMEAWQALWKY